VVPLAQKFPATTAIRLSSAMPRQQIDICGSIAYVQFQVTPQNLLQEMKPTTSQNAANSVGWLR
jgi:hypothetical protein